VRANQEILIHDIQEVKVVRENELPFSPSPNPYNPEDYSKVDSRLKRQIKNDERLHKLKLNLVRKQDGICLICGQVIILDLEQVERDHIIPKVEGGEDTFKNSMVIHKECHQKKTA
jgi:RNA-directed DNA polymerase